MSLCFAGPGGEVEQRWIVYALLRDNIQHHIERGRPTPAFEEIHRVAQALGGGQVTLSAIRLRSELERAQASLGQRPISELAISVRTRAVLYGMWPLPETDSTIVVGADPRVIPWLPSRDCTLDEVFGNLIRRLLAVSGNAREDDRVEVTDL
jgi:hypothetical protein